MSIQQAVTFGLFVFSLTVTACSCMAIPFTANIPLLKAAKKYSKNHGVMLGYQSVEDFYDTNSVMVDARSFFPTGTISVPSIKLFSGTKIDDALAEAACLAIHGGSVLKDLFTDMLAGRKDPMGKVENFVHENSMGLCGWVNNRRILLGNRELMTNHKIEGLPTLTKEKEFTEGGYEALYLSVSGNLAAMFILELTASPGVLKAMKQAEKNDIAIIVRSVDPFITITKMSQLFRYPEELIKMIPQRMMKDYDEETKPEKKVSASIASNGRISSFLQLLLSTKHIRRTTAAGITLQSAAALVGFVLVAITGFLNNFPQVSPLRVLCFQLGVTALTALLALVRRV